MVTLLVDPPHPCPLPPQGEREYYLVSIFIPSPPMGERVRVRGKGITCSLLSINKLAYL
jgi:hypothetical protein